MWHRHRRVGLAWGAALSFGVASSASAIDFDSLAHGEIATNQFAAQGVTISADNFHQGFDYAIGFDTRESGTRDDDLEAGSAPFWSGGNLAGQALDVILVLQENDVGCGDGVCDLPDDEGGRPAGNLIFDFDVALVAFGFDVVDVESAMAENGMVHFFVDGDDTPEATVSFMDFVTSGTDFYDPTIVFGNNAANRFAPITAERLGIGAFDRVIIEMGGSGGVDNLQMAVPEPGTGLLMGLALACGGATAALSCGISRGMPAYFIAQYVVNDRDLYQLYAQGAGPTIGKYGGEMVAFDVAAETIEGEPPGPQTVILKFESPEKAKEWYDSADYQAVVGKRLEATTGFAIISKDMNLG